MSDPQRAFFDARADGWEDRCYPAETRARLAEWVHALDLPVGATLLDLGAGTGVLYPYLRAAVGAHGRIVALDISHAMLRLARAKPLEPGDGLVQATVMQLPLADDAFDRVICFAAFPHFNDEASALREMTRVTRPGGTVVIAHLLSRAELRAHHARHQAVARDLLPDDASMSALFVQAGLDTPVIQDRPGRYSASARRSPESTRAAT